MKYQLFFLSKMLSLAVVFSSLFSACGRESASVTPADIVSSYTTNNPGTLLITGTIAYPAPAETNVPVNSQIVLIFSHDILPASANSTNITISPPVAGPHTYNVSGHVITVTLGSSMSNSTVYTVSTNTDLLGLSDSRHVSQNYSWNFTTAPNNSDSYQPRVIIRSPMGIGVPVNRNYIEVTFNEPVSNVTTTTFTISGGVTVSGVSNVAGTNTWRLNLSSVLAYNTLYTVDLTNAIVDSAGNNLYEDGMDTWNFQTELAPGANPALTLSNNFVGNVTDSSADLSWQTSYAVDNSLVKYGISTTHPVVASTAYGALGDSSQLFSVPLAALTAGTVYYYRIELPGATPNFLEGNFYSKNTVIPGTQIASGTNSALTALQLKLLSGAEDGSSSVLYSNAANANVSFFDSGGTPLWDSIIDDNSMTSIGISPDYSGGFFLSGINGGNVFVKRISTTGTFYYSYNVSTGLTVAAGNSSSVGVVYGGQGDPNVYPGFVTNNNVASGTATMNIPVNSFFDFGSDFTAGAFSSVNDGDIVIELGGGYDGTTVNKTGSNYRHAMGQVSVSVAPGNTYQFADVSTTDSFTAKNHTIRNAAGGLIAAYTSGLTFYSSHDTSPSAWSPPAWLGLNDVVTNGTNYGLVTAAPLSLNPFSGAFITSGNTYVVINTPACDYASNLLVPQGGSLGLFSGYTGYLVINTSDSSAARVSSVTTYFDDDGVPLPPPYDYETDALNLTAGIFDSAVSKSFSIYNRYCTEDLAQAYQTEPFQSVGADISITSGNTATFYNEIAGATGTADTPPVNPLYYDGYDFSTVNNNDIVLNISNYGAAAAVPNFSMINNITFRTSGALGMNTTTAAVANGNNFRILRFADSVQQDYMIDTGVSTSTLSLKLVASGADFSNARPVINAAVRISPGDIVYNVTQNRYAAVQAVDSPTQLSLSRDIFSAGDIFIVFYSVMNAIHEPIIDCGTATGAGVDTNADFVAAGVQPGDILRNISTATDSLITACTPTSLTLSSGTLSAGNVYVIIPQRFAVVYANGGNILAKYYRMTDASLVNTTPYSIYNGADTMVRPKISRGTGGNYYVSYFDSSNSNSYAKVVDGAGAIVTGGISTNPGVLMGAGEITKVESSTDGTSFYVLRKNAAGTNYYFARYNSLLVQQFTNSYTASDASFSIDSAGNSYVAYCDYSAAAKVVTIFKYDSAGAVLFSRTFELYDTVTPVYPQVVISKVMNVSVVPDGNGGAFVSWMDDRYFTIEGYHLVAVHLDSGGNPDVSSLSYSTGVSVGAYIGKIMGIPMTYSPSNLGSSLLYYDDGGAPYGALYLWYDYRNGAKEVFYKTLVH
ncbi:MAG: hypothetical protein BWX78_01473 [Firmicutes bacterium ADurb.Bin099]|nr:MAG: hypothetical protein BWX78_01473 [Firmicutes bacterium ADurb.Bin099]